MRVHQAGRRLLTPATTHLICILSSQVVSQKHISFQKLSETPSAWATEAAELSLQTRRATWQPCELGESPYLLGNIAFIAQ